jgi:hypothetical protein
MSLKYRPPGDEVQTLRTQIKENEHVPVHAIEDGDDATAGAIADAAVATDAPGTLSAKLRGIVKMLADVWDTASHSIKVKLTNANITLSTQDIEIGGVEIKNAGDDTRATVGANGLHVDVRASVLPPNAATQTTLAEVLDAILNLAVPPMTIGTPESHNTDGGRAATGDGVPCLSIMLQNSHPTKGLFWGNGAAQIMLLAGGASISIPCTDAQDVHVNDGPDGAVDYVVIPVIAAV